MSREIKFRAWDKNHNCMVSHRSFASFFNPNDGGNATTVLGYNPDWVVLMQYTGLKDKNGVEIYEGDVVRFTMKLVPRSKKVTAYVTWNVKSAHYQLNFTETSFTGFADKVPFDVEVIGNIYESPELMTTTIAAEGKETK